MLASRCGPVCLSGDPAYRSEEVQASRGREGQIGRSGQANALRRPDDLAPSYAVFAWDFGLLVLHFVRCGVYYCGAVASAIVALLGRFLPRLGPLAHASGPFFVDVPDRREPIRRPRGRAAAPRAGSRRGGRPAIPGRPQAARSAASARSAARPCRAPRLISSWMACRPAAGLP